MAEKDYAKKLGSSDDEVRFEGLMELCSTLRRRMAGFFWQRVKRREDVEDLIQETYLKLIKKEFVSGPLLPNDGTLEALEYYVWKVARNVWIAWYREDKRDRYISRSLIQNVEHITPEDFDRMLDDRETRTLLHTIILHIPNEWAPSVGSTTLAFRLRTR